MDGFPLSFSSQLFTVLFPFASESIVQTIDLQIQQPKPLFVLISVLDNLVYIDLTIFPVDRLGLSDYTTLLVFV